LSLLGELRGVIPYERPGCAVVFPSRAWHRTVIPAEVGVDEHFY
jgi:hypothetical protein